MVCDFAKGISLPFLAFSAFYISCSFVGAGETSIDVCPSGCLHQSLTEALKVAPPGATLRVQGGPYSEETLVIDKPLTLQGINRPIIDGKGQRQLLIIQTTDQVKISGFIFQNTGVSYTEDRSAIRVVDSKQCGISENDFIDTTYGVYLEKSQQCQITKNRFQGKAVDESSGGNAIHIWYGANHHIEGNSVSGHRDGIYLEFTKLSQIRNNRVEQNLRYGLHLMQAQEIEYMSNIFRYNGAGAAIMYSQKIVMRENSFSKNQGPATFGLLFKDVRESEVSDNTIDHNTVALYLEGSNRSRFEYNRIVANGWGLRIMGDCEENLFSQNTFGQNTFDVTTNSDRSYNTFSKNYWSQYDGYDLDLDGIGDRPYRPVSLSSVIHEKVDSSFVLMNSFFLNLMDQVERALPTLIPEPLKDESPLMAPVARNRHE